MPQNWRKQRNYLFVVPLCAAALFYQIAYCVAVGRDTFKGASLPASPFLSVDGTILAPSKLAQKAGLHAGDTLLSIDGKDVNNERDLYEDVDRHRPADLLAATETPKDQFTQRTLNIRLEPREESSLNAGKIAVAFAFALALLLCVLTGIYIALRRPADTRALAAFGLLISLSQVFHLTHWSSFPRPLWVFANLWNLIWAINWSFVLVVFGLYFPERFAWDRRRPWLKWLYLAPVLCLNSIAIVASLLSQFSFREFRAFTNGHPILLATPAILIAISITMFFLFMGFKRGRAKNPDLKRRLRILEAGAGLGLTPLGLFVLYLIISKPTEPPDTLVLVVCLLFLIFPCALAYTVLTERAMDLRVVVRQGVRYTLARNGLRIVFAVVGVIFFSMITSVLFRPGISDTTKILVMTASVAGYIILIGRVRSHMFIAIDKKFFREHYESEALLSELSENVRTIVDEHELLETVSRRVSGALHISHVSVLMNEAAGFRPVYSLGLAVPEEVALPENSKAVTLLADTKEPSPIYFDRSDNWVHGAAEDELVTLKALGAQLLLPLKAKEKMLGLFCLGPKLSEEPFTKSDINLLRSVALQTGLALDNSRLTAAVAQEVAQRERLNREIEIAREVQERLFPQHLPVIAGIDYSGACRPALGVGGDYYDFLNLPNGDLGVAIGDVSGKGIAAALLMASLQASLRGQALSGTADLAALLSNVNHLVYDATPPNRYATFFYGQYNRQTRVFRYVNAGHNPPFVLRKTSDGAIHVIRLDTGGPVVGLFLEAPYQQGSLTLHPGDVFVGFTDGISEAMNREEEEWGEDHLIHSVASHITVPAAEIIPRLMADADRFVDGAPQHDDMTLIVVKMKADAAALA